MAPTRPRETGRISIAWSLIAALCLLGGVSDGEDASPLSTDEAEQVVEPLDIGFTESTGRALLFLDVEARDKKGNALPGLTIRNFKLKLDFMPRKLYSVDDLCPCSAETGELAPELWNDPERLELAVGATHPRYVLYFDFSQLQEDGRRQALDAATRWVRETMEETDRVQLVAFSAARGLRRLTPFTADRDALVAALDDADAEPDFHDDYPSLIWKRRNQCSANSTVRAYVVAREQAKLRGEAYAEPFVGVTGPPVRGAPGGDVACYYHARHEYFRIRNSMLALLYYVTELDAVPERKALLFFHQNNATFPGRLYSFSRDGLGETMLDGTSSELVPDVARLLEKVSGAATQSRTSLFPVVNGYGETWSVNLGANVADATGGAYNLGAADVDSAIDAAGREACGCYYRLAMRAPDRGSHVYHAKVIADGHLLPRKYRLEFLPEDDRWMRRAEAVLASAGESEEVRMSAALIPRPTAGGSLDLEVQVAVDVTSLELIPESGMLQGEWEAGALLSLDDGRKSWELLDASRVRRKAGTEAPAWVLHSRLFDKLPAGDYELRAFAHDRVSDLWGSAKASVRIPEAEERALIGPVLIRPEIRHLPAELPIRKKKRKAKGRPVIRESVGGAVPASSRIERGERYEWRGWLCPGSARNDGELLHAGWSDGEPAEDPTISQSAGCVELRAPFSAERLSPGGHRYRLGFDPPSLAGALEGQGEIVVAPPETPDAPDD